MGDNAVVGAVLDYIVEQRLQTGDRLPTETTLTAMLDVSRPVLREAFSALELVGVLAARKGSGRIVMPYDFNSVLEAVTRFVPPRGRWLLDLLSIRQVLETSLLPVAAPMLSPAALARLEGLVSAMEQKAQAGAYFGAEDAAFHALLYEPLDNEVLQALLRSFWTTYDRLDRDELAHSQRLDETAAHHRRILDAINAQDFRLAAHHLNAHFYDTVYALTGGPAA